MESSQLPEHKRDEHLMSLLATVDDPDLHIPITSMGLIYGATFKSDKSGKAEILMTLTTVGCPLFDVIKKDINDALLADDKVSDTDIELTFDPPWHPGMMDEETQAEMGFF